MPAITVSFDLFGEFSIPTTLTVAELKTQLATATHLARVDDLYVGSTRLDDHHRVGQAPLITAVHLATSPGPLADQQGVGFSSLWQLAHLSTGELHGLSHGHTGLHVRVRAGRVRVKAAAGWQIIGKQRRYWEPGQVIRVRRRDSHTPLAYQLRGPGAPPSAWARLAAIPPARWIPALISVGMAVAMALILGRVWIMLFGLSFPLIILASALAPKEQENNANGPSRDLPRPFFNLGGPVDCLAGPHPCDLLDNSSHFMRSTDPTTDSFGRDKPAIGSGELPSDPVLPTVAVIGHPTAAVPFARGLIIGRASTGKDCAEVPNHGTYVPLAEDWMRWFEKGTAWTQSVLVLTPDQPIPSWCHFTAKVANGTVTWAQDGVIITQTVYCGLTLKQSELLARTVAARSAASAHTSDLPPQVFLPSDHDTARTGSSGRASSPVLPDSPGAPVTVEGLPVELGVSAGGLPVTFDLVTDGPHALVAGTTGAGKSELLQTLVLSLAARFAPSQVAIALVDYKGGAGFSHCRKLSHVVGMVTDLDPGSARRAIAGLRHQLKHRERLFAAHQVTNFTEFHRATAGKVTLPRVVIVVDELRALVEDEPEFVPDLMRIGAQGRSLGIHLVLATQRPAGAVTAEMRANLNSRLCLRVASPQDSLEVLQTPVAAQIPVHLAGRCYLQTGGSAVTEFQTYYAGGLSHSLQVAKALADPLTGALLTIPEPTMAHDPLLLRVQHINASHESCPPPQQLWAPALPQSYEFAAWPQGADTEVLGHRKSSENSPAPSYQVPLGIGEVTDNQTSATVSVPLGHCGAGAGNLAIVGPARSGHSTALRTLVAGAVGAGLAVHAVGETELGNQEELISDSSALLGTFIDHHEVQRITALFLHLMNQSETAPSVLFISDLNRLRTSLEHHNQGRGWDLLLELFRSAAHLRLTIVFTSTSGVPTVLAPFVSQTLVFLTNQTHNDQIFGVPRNWAGAGRIAGRGVLLGGSQPYLVQVARGYAPLGSTVRSQNSARVRPANLPSAVRIPALPTQVQLPTEVLGLTADYSHMPPTSLQTQQVPHSGSWLIAGGPRSGRTTTAMRFAHALAARGTLLRPAASDVTGVVQTIEQLKSAHGVLAGSNSVGKEMSPSTVVIDDVDELFTHHPQLVQQFVDLLIQHGHCLVVTVQTVRLAQRALPPQLLLLTKGIILMPTARSDMNFLGHQIEQHTDPARLMPGGIIPGRGVIVIAGTAKPIQIGAPS